VDAQEATTTLKREEPHIGPQRQALKAEQYGTYDRRDPSHTALERDKLGASPISRKGDVSACWREP
jgi:hypothetical protein